MIDLGDIVPLSVNIKDAAGALANATAVAVSITLPDGTVDGPHTVVSNPTGVYGYDYTTVQSGRHVVRWLATGTNASTYTDVFNVWPVDPRFLFSLDDAKSSLRRSWSTSTADDEDLRLYIAAVTPVIEDIVGPVGVQEFTRTFDGSGQNAIVLPFANISTALDTFTVSVNGVGIESTDYTLNASAGVLTFGGAYGYSGRWPYGRQNIEITFTAGLNPIPPNVILAAKEELRFLWQVGQQGTTRPVLGSETEDVEFTPSGFAVPRRVIELCAPHARGPVIA